MNTWNTKVQQIQDTTGLFVEYGQAFKKKCPQDRRIGTNWTKDRIDHYEQQLNQYPWYIQTRMRVDVSPFDIHQLSNHQILQKHAPPMWFHHSPKGPPSLYHPRSISAIVMFANM